MALIRSMLSQAKSLRDVEIVHIHGLGETPWIDSQYEGYLRTNSFFLTSQVQEAVSRGQADYTPCPLSEVPSLFSNGVLPIDVALIQITPPDEYGWCSLGVSVDVVKAAVESARVVIAQVNPHLPWIGGKALMTTKKISHFIEAAEPLELLAPAVTDQRHERIGQYAAQIIEDGSTLQVGLGNTPSAVVRALRDHHHLGIHTGMFSDELMELMLCGAVDNSAKNFKPRRVIASHVLGSSKLYEFVNRHAEIELHPSDWVNDPARIARNHRMVSINGARMIDLTGQVVRDSSGHHFYGGIGALQDFIRGAGRSKNGRPIIALTSTSDETGESRIVSGLDPGSGVVTGRGDVHYVVTEYGVANLYGRSIRDRVARLVEIAHPDHREKLLEGAHARGLLPKFFTMPPVQSVHDTGGIASRWVHFPSGKYLLRPLYPSDMGVLQKFFYSHDEETVRMRYGYQRESMTTESAYKLVAVDQEKDIAIGMFKEVHGRQELRAIGRYYMQPDHTSAEVAFVVHEESRRIGMSGVLLAKMAEVAELRGVRNFIASVLPSNRAMSSSLLRMGARRISEPYDDELLYELDVRALAKTARQFLEEKDIVIEEP
jgi:acyl-CoA hydrolase